MAIKGTKGNDHLKGTSKADVFDLSQGGNDVVSGLGGNDTFIFKGAFTARDQINGGAGTDVLSLAGDYSHGVVFGAKTIVGVETIKLGAHHDYKLTTNDANVARGKTLTVDGSKLGHGDTLTFNGSHETNGHFDIIGGKGADILTGGALADTFDLSHGGNDIANGGGGNDTFNMGAAFGAGDKINGGSGTDTLSLNGTYAALTAISGSAVTGIDTLRLGGGFNYNLAISGDIANGGTLTINASAAGSVHLDLSAASSTAYTITGSAGDDTFNFGDILSDVSIVTLTGGGGNDTVVMDGDYSGGNAITLTGAVLSGIGNIVLGAGHDYHITTADNLVDTGATLTIDAGALSAGDGLVLDTTSEAGGSFAVTGGAGDDVVIFGSANVAASSTFDGNGGNDEVYLDGDYSSLTNVTNILTNVETLQLDTAYSYDLKMTGEVAGGGVLDLTTTTLGGDVTFTMTSTATGSVGFNGSAGDDTLVIAAASQDNYFNGNGGNDTVELNGDFSIASTFGADTLNGAENLRLDAGHDYNVILNSDSTGAALTVDASALGSGNDMTFDFSADTGTAFTMTGGAGADTVAVGANLSEIAAIDLGGGNDTLELGGDYSAGYNFATLALTGVETLKLDGGQYNLTFTNSQVAGSHILAIDGSAVSDNLALDVSAISSGNYDITGGSGDDTFVVGAHLVASDTINGGGSVSAGNTLELAGSYSNLSLTSAHTTNISTVQVDDGFNYHLTIGSGTGITQVNGGQLTAGHSLYVDGSGTTGITLTGGADNDTLIGGSGADVIIDFGGANSITGHGGGDLMAINATTTLIYTALSDSHSTGSTLGVDSISSCNFSGDVFDVSAVTGIVGGVNAVDTAVTAGMVNRGATLAANIAAVIDSSHLGVGDAVLFTPDSGTAHTSGYAYLIVDCNGTAGYQASGDLLIELFQSTGTPTTANFG